MVAGKLERLVCVCAGARLAARGGEERERSVASPPRGGEATFFLSSGLRSASRVAVSSRARGCNSRLAEPTNSFLARGRACTPPSVRRVGITSSLQKFFGGRSAVHARAAPRRLPPKTDRRHVSLRLVCKYKVSMRAGGSDKLFSGQRWCVHTTECSSCWHPLPPVSCVSKWAAGGGLSPDLSCKQVRHLPIFR